MNTHYCELCCKTEDVSSYSGHVIDRFSDYGINVDVFHVALVPYEDGMTKIRWTPVEEVNPDEADANLEKLRELLTNIAQEYTCGVNFA